MTREYDKDFSNYNHVREQETEQDNVWDKHQRERRKEEQKKKEKAWKKRQRDKERLRPLDNQHSKIPNDTPGINNETKLKKARRQQRALFNHLILKERKKLKAKL